MQNIFQLALIECAYKQTWCEKKRYDSYVYHKQCDLAEHQCEKKIPHSNAYFNVHYYWTIGNVNSFIMKWFIWIELEKRMYVETLTDSLTCHWRNRCLASSGFFQ